MAVGGCGNSYDPWAPPPQSQPGPATYGGLLSVGTYPLSLGVRMWTAGCRKGSDPTPSAVPMFSSGIEEGSLVAVRL